MNYRIIYLPLNAFLLKFRVKEVGGKVDKCYGRVTDCMANFLGSLGSRGRARKSWEQNKKRNVPEQK